MDSQVSAKRDLEVPNERGHLAKVPRAESPEGSSATDLDLGGGVQSSIRSAWVQDVQVRGALSSPKDKPLMESCGWNYLGKGSGQRFVLTGVSLVRTPVAMVLNAGIAKEVLASCSPGQVLRLDNSIATACDGVDKVEHYKTFKVHGVPRVLDDRPCGFLPAVPCGSTTVGKAFDVVANSVKAFGQPKKVCVLFNIHRVQLPAETAKANAPSKFFGSVVGSQTSVDAVMWGGASSYMVVPTMTHTP